MHVGERWLGPHLSSTQRQHGEQQSSSALRLLLECVYLPGYFHTLLTDWTSLLALVFLTNFILQSWTLTVAILTFRSP